MSTDTRVTVCINSAKILEDLLSDQKDALLTIKDSALKHFADEHLRPKFDEHTKDWVNNTFRRNVRKQVRDACAEEMSMEELEPYIRNIVSKTINKIVDEELGTTIENKVRESIEKKIKKIKI